MIPASGFPLLSVVEVSVFLRLFNIQQATKVDPTRKSGTQTPMAAFLPVPRLDLSGKEDAEFSAAEANWTPSSLRKQPLLSVSAAGH